MIDHSTLFYTQKENRIQKLKTWMGLCLAFTLTISLSIAWVISQKASRENYKRIEICEGVN